MTIPESIIVRNTLAAAYMSQFEISRTNWGTTATVTVTEHVIVDGKFTGDRNETVIRNSKGLFDFIVNNPVKDI